MKIASSYFMIWKKQVHILNQRYGDVLFCCTGSDKNISSDRETLRRTDRRTDGHGDYNLPPPTKQKENKSFEEYTCIRQISLTYFLVTFFPCNILWMISSFDRNKTATTKTCKKRGQWVNFVFVSLYIVFSYICYRILSVSSL